MNIQLDEVYVIEPIRSRICGIRLLQDGKQILFEVQGKTSLVDFFGPGGKGHDNTFWIQSVEGKVELPVSSTTDYLTENTITLNVPPGGRQLLKNIKSGDRFILAVTKPATDK